MKILVKSVIICLATSIVAVTPLRSMEQQKETEEVEQINPHEKLVPVILGITFDDQGQYTTRILDSATAIHMLKNELSQIATQESQDYPQSYIDSLHQGPDKVSVLWGNKHTDKELALQAAKFALEGICKGTFGLTVLVLLGGKFVLFGTGSVAWWLLKKIKFLITSKGMPVLTRDDNDAFFPEEVQEIASNEDQNV